jgi:hypothetical protein
MISKFKLALRSETACELRLGYSMFARGRLPGGPSAGMRNPKVMERGSPRGFSSSTLNHPAQSLDKEQ